MKLILAISFSLVFFTGFAQTYKPGKSHKRISLHMETLGRIESSMLKDQVYQGKSFYTHDNKQLTEATEKGLPDVEMESSLHKLANVQRAETRGGMVLPNKNR